MPTSYFTVDRTGLLAQNLEFGDVRLLQISPETKILPRHQSMLALFKEGLSMHGVNYLTRFNVNDENNYHNGVIPDLVMELALEVVRLNRFPSLPSRFQCIFAWGSYEEALAFGKLSENADNTKPSAGVIYELISDIEQQRYDMSWLKRYNTVDDLMARAIGYWQHDASGEDPKWEYLIPLPIRIKVATPQSNNGNVRV